MASDVADGPDGLAAARKLIADGRLGEAERTIRSLIAADPNDAGAVEAMGDLALARGAFDAAAEFFDIAATLDPQRVSARISLGVAHYRLGRAREALTVLQAVIDEHPGQALALYWLAQAQLGLQRRDEGVANLQRALALWPNLISHMSIDLFERLKQCDWAGRSQMKAFLEETAREGTGFVDPLTMMSLSYDSEAILACARSYVRNYPPQPPLASGPWPPGERIRLAFLSGDFKVHPVATLIAGVLESLNRTRFEVTAVSYGPASDDDIRKRIERGVDDFLDVAEEDDAQVALRLADRRTDIAIGLHGYTEGGRPGILAFRPAPAQVSMLGYPGTMASPYVDYLVADRNVVPPGDERFYTERIVRMPHSYQCTDDKDPIDEEPPSRAVEELPPDAFVFMAYNTTQKVSPDIFEVWMRILARAPGSVLWLRDHTPQYRINLRREAAARGIDPGRLIFALVGVSRPEHLARHRLADIFLDTLPYNAHSTASDALWAGVPVLTCRGTTFPGRVCAGLVHSAGFPELITETLAEYEELAVALWADRPRLAKLRERVSALAPKSPLFDTAGYTRALERAFEIMHARVLAGDPPAAIDLHD